MSAGGWSPHEWDCKYPERVCFPLCSLSHEDTRSQQSAAQQKLAMNICSSLLGFGRKGIAVGTMVVKIL